MASSSDPLPLPNSETVTRIVAALRTGSPDFAALFDRYGHAGPALRHYGIIQGHRDDLVAARDAFRAAATLLPEDPDLWRDLAGACHALGDAAEAEICIATSLRYQPRAARSWLLLAQLKTKASLSDDAEAAFTRALALDPTLGDAHFGLGITYFARHAFDAAAASLRAAIDCGYANALGFTALGHVLYIAGRFAGCADAFETAARFGPLDAEVRRKYARARTFAVMIEGHPERAIADYAALAGPGAEDHAELLREAFATLCAYGYVEPAIAVGRLRLAQDPNDATQRYLLDAASGQPLTRAPVTYLESHFDRFAQTFDQKLVNVLRYQAPEDMAGLVTRCRTEFAEMLDLGCGTGLAGPHLAAFGQRLTGVDISAGMLQEAERKGLYTELVKSEVVEFLRAHPRRFDLIFAADVLIYFGDLEDLTREVARSIKPGGLFACSIETAVAGDYSLLSSGRFAHSPDYLERIAARDFEIVDRQATTIRLEAGHAVEGLLLVLERRATGGGADVTT